MILEGMDGKLEVFSAVDPRYTLHSATLEDGTRLKIKEDVWTNPDYCLKPGDFYPGPKYYIAEAIIGGGKKVDPDTLVLPEKLVLDNGTEISDFVCHAPAPH